MKTWLMFFSCAAISMPVFGDFRNFNKEKKLKELTPLQFRVTQKEATERPFDNEYWASKKEGIYVDIVSGEPLFSSTHKYKSGTGWPSFTEPIDKDFIVTRKDRKLFYTRIEVRSRYADSHLGHVFNDGPAPTGLRYCMNSAAMDFVPKEEMATRGYADYLYLFEGDSQQVPASYTPNAPAFENQAVLISGESEAQKEQMPVETQYIPEAKNEDAAVAILGSGCFWCTESDFDKLDGVLDTTSGYDGGSAANPSYDWVSSGRSGYTEVVKIEYDPRRLSYKEILQHYWKNVDPTVKNRQFCDIGPQYRSVIFYLSEEQKKVAEESLEQVKRLFPQVYTAIEPTTNFSPAEDYHQDYYLKNPTRYSFYRNGCGRDRRLEEVWKDKDDAAVFDKS